MKTIRFFARFVSHKNITEMYRAEFTHGYLSHLFNMSKGVEIPITTRTARKLCANHPQFKEVAV